MFQFKQFTIYQEQCAMKVTELACLQGAWTPLTEHVKTVLDIGFGTGLLSLMLAQRFHNIEIDAIEIDEKSFLQGKENIEKSKFASQINCYQGNVLEFLFSKKYDFVIVNPPFFENQLQSPNQQKNTAWHSSQLTLEKLVSTIKSYLTQAGCFSILLPIERKNELEKLATGNGFYLQTLANIQPTENLPVKYFMAVYSFIKNEIIEEIIIIKSGNVYTQKVVELMRDFYLKL